MTYLDPTKPTTPTRPPTDADKRAKLLLVDDLPANIQVLYRALAADYQVYMATSGEAALAMCRDKLPDLVLLDVVMPDLGGHEVCRRLKHDAATRDIPVIFVTAHDDPLEESHALGLGAVDFIAKPISPAVVRARVKTHLDLAQSRLLIAATLEATADGILATDLNGGISSRNLQLLALWNLPLEPSFALSDAELFERIQSQTKNEIPARIGSAEVAWRSATETVATIELANGRQLERHCRPLLAHGRLQGHVYSFRDVTERAQAQLAMRHFNETLEKRIRERTSELEEARRIADCANQAKSLLLSNMSHEIRTPMNSILGTTYLALKAEPSPKQRSYLERISHSGEHLLALLNQLLDFSKIEAGKLDLVIEDFSVGELLTRAVEDLGENARRQGLDLVIECDPGLSRNVRGDPLRLSQVLINYLGNAIKFSSSGRVTMRADVLGRDEQSVCLRLQVEDQGIGIAADNVAKLFNAFQQADASTTRKYGGTGLGLAICKQLAELMGGEVGVDSRLGGGSRFWFDVTLPWGLAMPARLVAEETPDALDPCRFCGLDVLVVDDNVLNQQVAAELLSSAGATVFIAGNGQEAIEQLSRRRADFVLMDVQMPVMDGLEATRRIRAAPSLSTTRVIAMTANVGREDQINCMEAGMDDFLTKPVIPDVLFATIDKWRPPKRMLARDAELIDLSILAHMMSGNQDKVKRFARIFVEEMTKTIGEIEVSFDNKDRAALSALGHRAKSSARTVGALGLARLFETLQGLQCHGEVEDMTDLVHSLAPLLGEISREIDAASA